MLWGGLSPAMDNRNPDSFALGILLRTPPGTEPSLSVSLNCKGSCRFSYSLLSSVEKTEAQWVGYWQSSKPDLSPPSLGFFPPACVTGSLSSEGAAFLSTRALVLSDPGSQERGSFQSFRKSRSQTEEAPGLGSGYLGTSREGNAAGSAKLKHKGSEHTAEVSLVYP